jgi:2-keto-3-deoxy-L-rhamnonate aldolase RhmA
MDLPANPFKRAIKSGRQQIGLWSSLSSHLTVEVIAGSGYDWLLLDTGMLFVRNRGRLAGCRHAGASRKTRTSRHE